MGAIDVGLDTDIGYTSYGGNTQVDKANPANDTGIIDTVTLRAQLGEPMTNTEVALFSASSNNLTTRSSANIGTVTGLQTFTGLSLAVVSGDYIGCYASGGKLRFDNTGGVGVWYSAADYIPCTSQAFSYLANYSIAIYGTGVTVAAYQPHFSYYPHILAH